MKRILVTGSRGWQDRQKVREILDATYEELSADGSQVTLVSGACPSGVDRMAEDYWKQLGHPLELHPAKWEVHGVYNPMAGYGRNELMVRMGADVCLAFIRRNSRGASHCATKADLAGIEVRYYREG